MNPVVSFIVPCYKLANLLGDCVRSILRQSYQDFEILIMDDCSPDNTPEVARSFEDSRVLHVRNETNAGHLRNYNEGIRRSRGQYIWLISADDMLRSDRILERYMKLLERNPRVGFVFCPAVALRGDIEGETLDWSTCGAADRIWSGQEFLNRILTGNCVATPSAIVRRECYEKVGPFPLDLPFAGDWYLWCAFALHFDVAYLSEPMVFYRLHCGSMTNAMARRRKLADNNEVLWRIMGQTVQKGYRSVVKTSIEYLSNHYAFCVASGVFGTSDYAMTIEEMEASFRNYAGSENVKNAIRARVYTTLADHYYRRQNVEAAKQHYGLALSYRRYFPKVWVKDALLHAGKMGSLLRDHIFDKFGGRHFEHRSATNSHV